MRSEQVAKKSVQSATANPDFMRETILKIVSGWTPGEPLVIETAQAKELNDYFTAHAKQLLDEGKVSVQEINGTAARFTVKPANGAYKVEFGEDEFISFFKSFLRPGLVETLFN